MADKNETWMSYEMHRFIVSNQKSKATKLMLHEIQLFLRPGLYSSMEKCFLHCSELLSQMTVEKERPGILYPNAGPYTVTAPIRTC